MPKQEALTRISPERTPKAIRMILDQATKKQATMRIIRMMKRRAMTRTIPNQVTNNKPAMKTVLSLKAARPGLER